MAPHTSAQPFLGIALKVASTLVFTAMATLIKLVSDRYPVGELVFFRSAFALLPVFVWVGWREHTMRAVVDVFRTERLGSHVIRSVAGASGMFLGFAALTLLPIADATAIGYAAPLMTVVFAALLLGERVHVSAGRRSSLAFAACSSCCPITSDRKAPAMSGASPAH